MLTDASLDWRIIKDAMKLAGNIVRMNRGARERHGSDTEQLQEKRGSRLRWMECGNFDNIQIEEAKWMERASDTKGCSGRQRN